MAAMTAKERAEVAFQEAGFAGAAVARLVDVLFKAGVIDELVLGEIEGMAIEGSSPEKPEWVQRRMGGIKAKLRGG